MPLRRDWVLSFGAVAVLAGLSITLVGLGVLVERVGVAQED